MLKNQASLRLYISSAIKQSMRNGHNFILAPYFESCHWLLLVICPSVNTIYMFDSAGDSEDTPRNVLIKTHLNSQMKTISGFGLRRASIPTWKSMKCAQQTGGVECGYYVMRYMYDIVRRCTSVEDIDQVFKTPRVESFTSHEIDVVRDKFALFMLDNCL